MVQHQPLQVLRQHAQPVYIMSFSCQLSSRSLICIEILSDCWGWALSGTYQYRHPPRATNLTSHRKHRPPLH